MSAKIIAFTDGRSRKDTHNRRAHGLSTTYRPHLERHYQTRLEAHEYLSSRGFLLLPFGWMNGRWRACVEMREGEFVVIVDMPSAA